MSAGRSQSVRPTTIVRSSSRVQSVQRAAALLRALAAAPGGRSSAPELADACGLNRATAYRILHTLAEDRLVTFEKKSGSFAIGPGLLELARPAGVEGLLRSARPVLARLALQTGETAAVAVVRNEGLTYVDEVAPSAIVAASWRGRVVPLHATSTGKALLAFSERAAVRWMLEDPLTAYTATTVTDAAELEAELEQTRVRGYGVCRGEYDATAFGVSAPVLGASGQPVAVLSIWGPEGRVGDEQFGTLGALVAEAAAGLGGH